MIQVIRTERYSRGLVLDRAQLDRVGAQRGEFLTFQVPANVESEVVSVHARSVLFHEGRSGS